MIDLTTVYHLAKPWFARFLAMLPAKLARRFYSATVADSHLVSYVVGNQCRFELLHDHPMHTFCSLNITMHNFLPFDIRVIFQHVECYIDSQKFMAFPLTHTKTIQAYTKTPISLPETPLTNQQVLEIKALGREYTRMSIAVQWRCESNVRHWDKSEVFDVMAYICKDKSDHQENV